MRKTGNRGKNKTHAGVVFNQSYRFQISEYKNFVKNLTEVSNIMSKFFYVVVPFAPSEDQKSGLLDKMLGIFQPKKAVKMSATSFDTYRSQLLQRVDHVTAALSSTHGATCRTQRRARSDSSSARSTRGAWKSSR